MLSLFNFNSEEILTFFAVLVRYSVLFVILPFIGDRMIPAPLKILFSLVVSVAIFPPLVSSGRVQPASALLWGNTASGIATTLALEVITALVLGFTARLVFDGITIGSNLVGTFMGFATASTYDPHQESHSAVVAQLQTSLAMLVFLSLDGHHLMLRAVMDSYGVVGLGRASLGALMSKRLIQLSSEIIKFGVLMSGPVAVALFAVNVAFGIFSRAMPQLNILVISMSVTTLIGLLVLFISVSDFYGVLKNLFGEIENWLRLASWTLVPVQPK